MLPRPAVPAAANGQLAVAERESRKRRQSDDPMAGVVSINEQEHVSKIYLRCYWKRCQSVGGIKPTETEEELCGRKTHVTLREPL